MSRYSRWRWTPHDLQATGKACIEEAKACIEERYQANRTTEELTDGC